MRYLLPLICGAVGSWTAGMVSLWRAGKVTVVFGNRTWTHTPPSLRDTMGERRRR